MKRNWTVILPDSEFRMISMSDITEKQALDFVRGKWPESRVK